MSYFKRKEGSVEEAYKKLSDDYQQMFKKELEKTGKSLGSMSDREKKDFFNKIDKKYNAKMSIAIASINNHFCFLLKALNLTMIF